MCGMSTELTHQPSTNDEFSFFDRMKLHAVMAVRAVNKASIERWSTRTFRAHDYRDESLPAIVTAASHYSSSILPDILKVPAALPLHAKLKMSYVVPYYILAGVLFRTFLKLPLSTEVRWSEFSDWNAWFPPHPEGWTDIHNDADFTAMRLQGPNPFLLQKGKEKGVFELDFGPAFDGVYAPVKATFQVIEDKLAPINIRVGDDLFTPEDEGWARAKFIVNGLDARYTVFLRHLMHTHLISGQAFSIASYALANDHPFRPFVDFFTYGTLAVNDYAFKLLVTPASYFLQCGFLDGKDVGTLFDNFQALYTLDKLIPPKDIAERGIDEIPNHPYAEDAPEIWAAISEVVAEHVDLTHHDDASVRDDVRLQDWYAALLERLPDRTLESHPLDSIEAVVEILSASVYLNVYHEVCGDFSPFVSARTQEGKRLINMANLRNPDLGPARAADVFLFDQGAWAGRFDNGGNFLMSMDLESQVSAVSLRKTLMALQDRLRALDHTLEARNRRRRIPLLRLLPRRWKASISY
jgi:hypothetical protein